MVTERVGTITHATIWPVVAGDRVDAAGNRVLHCAAVGRGGELGEGSGEQNRKVR